ncbi:sulfate ABC transporter substrate-binding protein [Methylobacter sp. Wu8]|uniref:sulfate ABC transporter substrate-binding protein n=1 Tax=Methylobacter sp. Wu8 TaxID=3118457 RepID=UPI002F337087
MKLTKPLKHLLFALTLLSSGTALAERTILNVSYDPTRELYQDYNKEFIKYWKEKTGEDVGVQQSHGGGGKQTRAVIDGLEADVVTLALSHDIDQIVERAGVIPKDWQTRLPNNSLPYTSTIVFLVHKGNPKGIKNWDDLAKDGVSVITPNPKTSGGARYNYLAAWAFGEKKFGGKEAAKDFVKKIYKNAPVLDSGARGSTTTFIQRGIGDVLITWENEAFLAVNEQGAGEFEIVVPPVSIKTETPVAVVEKVAKKNDNLDLAEGYLQYLYSPIGQKLAAKHFYRPYQPEHANPEDLKRFPKLELFTVSEKFGSWAQVQKEHFDDGGLFDQIYKP